MEPGFASVKKSRRQSAGSSTRGRSTGRIPKPATRPSVMSLSRLSSPPRIQAKLRIGAPNDRYEQEADRVADQVMRMPEPAVQRVCSECEEELGEESLATEEVTPQVQRTCSQCETEEVLQRSSQPGVDAPAASHDQLIAAARSGGRALSSSERSFFEPRFGVDFGAVRIRDDARADAATRAIGARAYALGNQIAFRSGEYHPASSEGRKLLAHELVHTLQQGAIARHDQAHSTRRAVSKGVSKVSRRSPSQDTVQRTITNLAVAGTAPEAGQATHSVVARGGGPVIVTATTSAPGQVVRWTGGRRQAGNPLQRRVPVGLARTHAITADTPTDPGARNVTVHVVNGRAAPANTPANLGFSRQRGNPPGLAPFGLTDISTNNPTSRIRAFLVGNQWVFRVERIRHRFQLGVQSGGNTDIPNAARGARANHCNIITDLTPPAPGVAAGPPRANFWSRRITTAHEFAHVSRFYSPPFWERFMRIAEASIEGAASNVNVDHTVPTTLSARATVAANSAAHQAILDVQHNAADVTEFIGTEVFAHGQSNPRYTTLVLQIAARARPLAPTALVAAALGPASVRLTWTDNACNETEYRVFRRRGARRFTQVATLPAGSTTFTDTSPGLVTATTYTYTVAAAGVAGQSRRSNRSAITTP